MKSFTQGQWLVRYNSVTTALNLKIVDGEENPICEFPDPIYSNSKNGIKSEMESKANAHLIAAAPDMIKALEEVYSALTTIGGPFIRRDKDGRISCDKTFEALCLVERAIEKARGGE